MTGKKRVSKDDVVREATRLFAERGFDGLTMGELAERVGLRKPSLFHHFATKEAVYEKVLGDLITGVRTSVVEAAFAPGSIKERLDRLSDALTTTLGAQPDAARLLVREAIHPGPVLADKLGAEIDLVLDAARMMIVQGQREGVFDRDLDPTHVIITLVGVHFMPFAIGDVMERFAGTQPSHPAFISARTVAVRDQVRRLLISAPPAPQRATPSKKSRAKTPRTRG